jgi:hypothetical protein
MKISKRDIVKYRLARAWETLDDARILSENEKWNSTINRLYYSAFDKDKVLPYFEPVQDLLKLIEKEIRKRSK